MEEIVRVEGVSLEPEHGRRVLPIPLEVDLQKRIRSLLLARNEKRPPKAPCPTPDYIYLSRYPQETPIGNRIAPVRKSVPPRRAVAQLEKSHSIDTEMGATRFDGPAGQFQEGESWRARQDLGPPGLARSPSIYGERKRASHLKGSNPDPRPASGAKLSPGGEEKSRPKRQNKSSSPKISFTLRTVAPNQSKTSESRSRPTHQHVPGSYRSEKEPLNGHTQTATPSVAQTPAVPQESTLSSDQHRHAPPIKAIDALHKIQDHLENSEATSLAVRERSSRNSLNSTSRTVAVQISLTNPDSISDASNQQTKQAASPVLDQNDVPHLKAHQAGHPQKHASTDSGDGRAPDNRATLDDVGNSSHQKHQAGSPADKAVFDESKKIEHEPSAVESLSIPSTSTSGTLSKVGPHQRDISESSRNPREVLQHKWPDSESPDGFDLIHQSSGRRSPSPKQPEGSFERPLDEQTLRETAKLPIRQADRADTESTDESVVRYRDEQKGQSFDRAITELESLLKEALDIADQSAVAEPHARKSPSTGNIAEHMADSDRESISSMSTVDGLNQHEGDESFPEVRKTKGVMDVSLEVPESKSDLHSQRHMSYDLTPYPRSLNATRHQSLAVNNVGPADLEDDDGLSGQAEAQIPDPSRGFTAKDWAVVERVPSKTSSISRKLSHVQFSETERHPQALNANRQAGHAVSRPQIQPRGSSLRRRSRQDVHHESNQSGGIGSSGDSESTSGPYVADFRNSALRYHPVIQEAMGERNRGEGKIKGYSNMPNIDDYGIPMKEIEPEPHHSHPTNEEVHQGYSLKDRHHFSIREPHGFSLSRSHRRAPIARDWNPGRKRFVAIITCLNTAFLGIIIGVYAGEVPAIQYTIADEHHYTILGNVALFLGLATTTFLFWPLPLLHGRKPYTMGALILLMLLQFPQALTVARSRNPSVATYRVGLLVPRALAGLVMGFAVINFKTTLLDLFGASLQSGNPHQEVVNENDVRRHGGGMGVWLGIWTWCAIGSIGLGFWIGASIISGLAVAWGFWITIILNAFVLLLNVITPEVRRSPYRRSMAEVRSGTDVSRRIARGEVKMHLDSTGPVWWWEEVFAGLTLSFRMLKQPGFAILSFYMGWIYGQVVLVIVVSRTWNRVSSEKHIQRLHVAAPRCIAVKILLFPPPVCRAVRCDHSTRSHPRNSLPEGIFL